jgi:hypothetical protein
LNTFVGKPKEMVDAMCVEQEFDLFFRQIGFKRISTLVGLSPDFHNADYVNENLKLVVELKILDKDHFQNGGIIDRFHGFVAIPIPGRVDKDGMGVYDSSWPPINREGKNDTFEEPLRKIIKSANRQLKETKAHLFSGHGTGLLMLALNQFRSLSPVAVLTLACALLQDEFSAINGCIVCTPS